MVKPELRPLAVLEPGRGQHIGLARERRPAALQDELVEAAPVLVECGAEEKAIADFRTTLELGA